MKYEELLQELEAERCFADDGFQFNDESITDLKEIKYNERKLKWEFVIELDKFHEDKESQYFKDKYFDFFEIKGNRKTNRKETYYNMGINFTTAEIVKVNPRTVAVYERIECRGRFYNDYAFERKDQFFERIKYLIGLTFPNATFSFKK